ncbi:MAG: nucleotide sugar dehydrogenase [Verrucomicrobiales bacterium]|nr:nucleotide sugar dehydrogenase [Verrucomicrobiales bacterium]
MSEKIAVVGLGYVGLPLAVCLAREFEVIGFDVAESRVRELSDCHDRLEEVSDTDLKGSEIEFSSDSICLESADVIIVTVPTPVNEQKRPDLSPLLKATETVSRHIKEGAIVVFESTVYPGVTEQECVPILELSGARQWKKDFFVGYSPERINPGDREHTVDKITKVVAGDTPETAATLERIYGAVITAGIFVADSIQTAEAAKVIENCQRDINIAFVNELALIFQRLGIDTTKVLEAAGTKWNFLPFRPGLVGGHCIGVDPYYLTHKAESVGYHPQVILSGRRINDGMGVFVANRVIKLMIAKGNRIRGARVLVMGVTFKENCPDVRNSRVVDIVAELAEFGVEVEVYDPEADVQEVKREYGLELLSGEALLDSKKGFSAVILAVAHNAFSHLSLRDWLTEDGVLYDVKSTLPPDTVDERL